jgi:hypothetical protein
MTQSNLPGFDQEPVTSNQQPVTVPQEPYHREPFAADVSEGKNDPIYNAHSYHTKVPHKAIMRYILHYTQPGDIVFDGFCGTGMTGVAAQMCGDREVVESLGYKVDKDGVIYQETEEEPRINTNEHQSEENNSCELVSIRGSKKWRPFSKLGVRRAVLNDLSPAATFIAYNYNTPVDVAAFEKEAKRILKEVEKECGWMYETLHTDGKTKGKINYTVRAGFKKAWQERDYAVIVAVADKIPNNVLEEDPKLLMWYDQAVTRMGG